jgi:hypothetical protein
MSESLVGFDVAATRQNAGRLLKSIGGPIGMVWPGTVKPPAGTISARVMVVWGSLRAVNFWQSSAKAGQKATASVKRNRKVRVRMIHISSTISSL